MIHQFIFAGPRPGLGAEAFKSYWINFHAVDYAAKIPQIRQYLVADRLDLAFGQDLPFYQGVAEIWLANEDEQIASLQTPEFLEGARRDEPRWAAFWQTLVLDTEVVVLKDFVGPQPWPDFVKLYTLVRRRADLPLQQFRAQFLEHRRAATADPVERHIVAFSRANQYGLGEPRFDAVEVRSFRSRDTLEALLAGKSCAEFGRAPDDADPRYVFNFVGRENWIIRPGAMLR
jgi:EthD domain